MCAPEEITEATSKLTRLAPSAFVWEKYLSKVNISLSDIYVDPYRSSKFTSDITVVGYCPAKLIQIRQRPTGYVLMLEAFGEEFWLHANELPA
jgi:hypothetical protein